MEERHRNIEDNRRGQQANSEFSLNAPLSDNNGQIPRRKAKYCWHSYPFQLLLCLLNVPCVIYSCFRIFCKRCKKSFGHRGDGGIHMEQWEETVGEAMEIEFLESKSDISDMEAEEYAQNVIALKTSNFHSTSRFALEQELVTICENGFSNKLQLLLEHFSFEGSGFSFAKMSGMVAKAIDADQIEVSEMWIRRFPMLLHEHLEEGRFKGLTLLHVAIIKRKLKIIDAMLDLCLRSSTDLRTLLHQRAFIENSALGRLCPCAELPLNLAVWVGDEEILRALIDHGAEMDAEDSKGHNILHTVVLLADTSQHLASAMLESLLSLVPLWLLRSKNRSHLRDLDPIARTRYGKQLLFLAEDGNGFTPLKLAAKLGIKQVVDKIMNVDEVYRFSLFCCGNTRTALYDVSELDPNVPSQLDQSPTVLESIAANRSIRHLHLFEVPVIQRLFQLKMTAYLPFMVLATAMHLLLMTVATVSACLSLFPRMLTESQNAENGTDIDRYNTSSSGSSLRFTLYYWDYIMLAVALFILLHCSAASWHIWTRFRKRNAIRFSQGHFLVHILTLDYFFTFSVSIFLYLIVKACESDLDAIFLSWAMSLGWMCTFSYTRIFKRTANFSIVLEQITLRDLLRFTLVILIIVLCFSLSTMTLFAVDVDLESQGFTFSSFAWKLFEVSVGVSSVELTFEGLGHEVYLRIIYFGFILMVPIIVMTLLIAAMNHTYSEMGEYAHLLCQSVQLTDVVTLEAAISPWLRQRPTDCYTQRTVRVCGRNGQLLERHLHLLECETTVNLR